MADATKPGTEKVINPFAEGHCFAVIPYTRTLEDNSTVTGAYINVRLQPYEGSEPIVPLLDQRDSRVDLTSEERAQLYNIMQKLGILTAEAKGYTFSP